MQIKSFAIFVYSWLYEWSPDHGALALPVTQPYIRWALDTSNQLLMLTSMVRKSTSTQWRSAARVLWLNQPSKKDFLDPSKQPCSACSLATQWDLDLFTWAAKQQEQQSKQELTGLRGHMLSIRCFGSVIKAGLVGADPNEILVRSAKDEFLTHFDPFKGASG